MLTLSILTNMYNFHLFIYYFDEFDVLVSCLLVNWLLTLRYLLTLYNNHHNSSFNFSKHY